MKRLNILTFAIQFLIGTDTFLVALLLPLLTQRFHNPSGQAGWMISAYAIGYCVTAIFSGPVSDHFDRKHVLIVGMLGFSLATATCGIAWSFPSMIVLCLLAGVMAAIGSPQVWASIPQLVAENEIIKSMAAPTLGLTVAQIAGVPVGSFLASQSPSDPFLVVGAASLLATIAVAIWFPNVKPTAQQKRPLQQYTSLLHTRHALPRFAAYLVFQTGNFAVMSFIASWFSKDFQLSTQGIGMIMIVLGAGNTLGALIGPQIVARIGQWRALFLSMGGYTIAYLLLPLGAVLAFPVTILTCTFFIGGMLFPVFMSLMQSLTTTARGTVSALANVLMYLGSTIAGIIGGPLLSALPGFWSISILAVITTIGSTLLWKCSRTYHTANQ
ncbi:MAG: MFS transporter [Bifidobacterium aquikefiri]|uniref:Multidrug ABC transporter permease n=1 Tax=Bifidobacterium aquikefiri TaxID=1653207 RepID=A0A261G933_9BIFI|nr:MFS transporter [Bifidobacterium aquikefiri]OZG67932.1 multidrug ABC transporter permease [Bifidobacterium aquikefiri]